MNQHRAFRKIDRKIYNIFLVVIAIAILNAVISTSTLRNSHRITSELVHTTSPSLDALDRFNLLVNRAELLTTNWVYFPEKEIERAELKMLNDVSFIALRGRLQGLMTHWEDTMHTSRINTLLTDYEMLIGQQTAIMRMLPEPVDHLDSLKKAQSIVLLETIVLPECKRISRELERISVARSKMAVAEQDRMLYGFNRLQVLVFGIALLIICSIVFAAGMIAQSVIHPVMQVRKIILRMGKGELPDTDIRIPKNAVGEMIVALSEMVEGFRRTSRFVEEVGKGNLQEDFTPLSERDVQGHALIRMQKRLVDAADQEKIRRWSDESIVELNRIIRSEKEDMNDMLEKTVELVVDRLKVEQAAIFIFNNEDMNDLHIQLGAHLGLNQKILNSHRYELKNGLIGQVFQKAEPVQLVGAYDPYFTIEKETEESTTCNILILPLITGGKVVGALHVASLCPINEEKVSLLEKLSEPIAASIYTWRANLLNRQLLDQSKKQAEELAYQEQELKQANHNLQEKARLLGESNDEIERARQSLEFKAKQLEQSNRYKSSFLANMSHELRTPLNSILILAKLLSDNRRSNLDDKQVEHARIIHKSGSDLLNLINDILDLSKIEAGRIDLNCESVDPKIFAAEMHMLFKHYAEDRKIRFKAKSDCGSEKLYTDRQRLDQVVKNLLSNALKFTAPGGLVECLLTTGRPDISFKEIGLINAKEVICISVKDNGIGIPKEKHAQIFEAFQQADNSTSRRFGGTGLGLTISKELVQLMGGEIHLESEEGIGSCFAVYLPAQVQADAKESQPDLDHSDAEIVSSSITQQQLQESEPALQIRVPSIEVKDDRHNLQPGDRTILIVEDDYIFASMMMLHCHRKGYKAVIALDGAEGLDCAERFRPHAIILDLRMPVMDGWTVLKRIKQIEHLRNIPIHVLSAVQKNRLSLDMGAVSYLKKPTSQEEIEQLFDLINTGKEVPRQVLYVGNDSKEEERISHRLREQGQAFIIKSVSNLHEGECLAIQTRFCGMIIGSDIPVAELGMLQGFEGLKGIPSVTIDQLEDELPCNKSVLCNDSGSGALPAETELRGKTVLLVDDDMRNIYSLTHVLEEEGIKVISAYNGRQAITQLEAHGEVDVVLMDMMMPELNGYETTRLIRQRPHWKLLPIIAVTAQAMQGDREKCMDAGASDFLSKPVKTEELLSLLKVWMYR
jgi:signal transduction histidine kinase/DNA-binding response OmpR family regulator